MRIRKRRTAEQLAAAACEAEGVSLDSVTGRVVDNKAGRASGTLPPRIVRRTLSVRAKGRARHSWVRREELAVAELLGESVGPQGDAALVAALDAWAGGVGVSKAEARRRLLRLGLLAALEEGAEVEALR